MLQTLIKWIIAGPRNELETEKRKRYIDQRAKNITQLIYQATKSDSQLRYKPTSDSNKTFYNKKETPFSVSLGLLIHKKIRSKDIVNILANLNLLIDYEKVLRIETNIANAVVQRALKNIGVSVPPSIQAGLFNLQLITVTSRMTQLIGRASSTELHRLCTSNHVLMLSPKSYKSIATKIDPSIMINFQLVKLVQSQNQKMKSTLSLPKKIKTLICIKNGVVSGFWQRLKRENSTNVIPTWAAYN